MSPSAIASFFFILIALGAIAAWVFLKRRAPRVPLYRAQRIEDLPDIFKPLTVYLVGEDDHLWAAALICPCGCGERIELNLLPQARPCWSVERHPGGTVTLMPSVWRQKGCKSHFFVRNGRIDWC